MPPTAIRAANERCVVSRRARHSLGTQLSGAALGRVLSVDQAASMLGVDRNSIRRWMREHPADDDWQIIERMAGAQLVERVAKGLVKSARDLATILGIAGRNVRAKELIALREARRSNETCDCVLPPGWISKLHPEPGTLAHVRAVWSIAAAKMSENRRLFMESLRPLVAHYIDHKEGDTHLDIPEAREATVAALAGVPNDTADPVGALQRWIEELDDEAVAARQALADAAHKAYREAIQGELRRRAYPEAPPLPEPLEPPTAVDEPVPLPTARVERPKPVPMVLDTGYERDGHRYDLDTGERRPRYR